MLCKLHISNVGVVFFLKWSQKKRGYILDIPLSFVLLVNLELNVLNWAFTDRIQTLNSILYSFTVFHWLSLYSAFQSHKKCIPSKQ